MAGFLFGALRINLGDDGPPIHPMTRFIRAMHSHPQNPTLQDADSSGIPNGSKAYPVGDRPATVIARDPAGGVKTTDNDGANGIGLCQWIDNDKFRMGGKDVSRDAVNPARQTGN
jgi:hypothetical protein